MMGFGIGVAVGIILTLLAIWIIPFGSDEDCQDQEMPDHLVPRDQLDEERDRRTYYQNMLRDIAFKLAQDAGADRIVDVGNSAAPSHALLDAIDMILQDRSEARETLGVASERIKILEADLCNERKRKDRIVKLVNDMKQSIDQLALPVGV